MRPLAPPVSWLGELSSRARGPRYRATTSAARKGAESWVEPRQAQPAVPTGWQAF